MDEMLIHSRYSVGSSFAENFYGLRRRRRPGIATPRAKKASSSRATQQSMEALRRIDINVSLLMLVGLPYAQTKLHDLWESLGGGIDAGPGGGLFGDEEEDTGEGGGRAIFRDGDASASRVERLRTLLRVCFRKGYPYAGAAWQLWLLAYNVGYLFEKTPFWRPWFKLMRMDIRRVGSEDYVSVSHDLYILLAKAGIFRDAETIQKYKQAASPPLLPPNMPNPLREPARFALQMLRSSPFIFFEALKYALPASIFFFKFLEWWYSPDNSRRRRRGRGGGGNTGSGEAGGSDEMYKLEPPRVLSPNRHGVLFNKASDYKDPYVPRSKLAPTLDEDGDLQSTKDSLLHNSCPLCGATPMNNPCALPTGYVFCYTCAFAYVEENKRCPVTLAKVHGTSELRRVLG